MTQSAISVLTDHFARLGLQCYEVPGVKTAEGEPLKIYFTPPTNAQGNAIAERAKGNAAQTTLYTVLLLSKDEAGNRLFEENAATVQALTEQVPGRILTLIATAIMKFTGQTDLGNSSGTVQTQE
ncbi:hypothetical protein J7443_17595 [Tropicibacter sp. R15_0]|uniref:hypothetical protein n=1 Tax=Tropicibacter sp. R15_0 TaxID=2821101 RepID=UPI001ADA91DD|nr:hypothetical protein [Tropicibacter sp. R15_0]MBO9467062.1 hypothetical protein [Tropicibacter sp. R15_0]